MSKKVIISAAQRLAKLKFIPSQKLPSTLKTQILVPNLQQIRLHYRPMCKGLGPSLQLVRKYGPALRFYNPGLTVTKKQDAEGPISMVIQVFRKNVEEPVVIDPSQCKNVEELLDRVRKINEVV